MKKSNVKNGRIIIIYAVVIGVLVNVIFSFLVKVFNLPLYLDTIGTISVSAMCCTFPGIVAAVVSNSLCSLFNSVAVYFSILNAITAILSAYAWGKGWFKKPAKTALFIFYAALISGGGGALIQWQIFGEPQYKTISDTVMALSESIHLPKFVIFIVLNIGLNIVDKTVTTLISILILHFIPERIKKAAWNNGWKQKPLTMEEIEELGKKGGRRSKRLQTRTTALLAAAVLAIIAVIGFASVRLYADDNIKEHEKTARMAASFAATIVDADMLETFLQKGSNTPGFMENLERLKAYKNHMDEIEYLYIYKITQNGCYCILDTYFGDDETASVGYFLDFDPVFEKKLDDFLEGRKIEPIVTKSVFGMFITCYEPIFDSNGKLVAYAGADVSLSYFSEFIKSYIVRTLLISAGFLIVVLAFGLWVSGVYLVYPLNSMAACASGFAEAGEDQESLDLEVKRIKALDIRTGDEIEHLYRVMCEMTEDTAERVRDVRHYTTAVTQMQRGLIITMADLVENRDSDTGSHVQKTAAYVKIILEGLKKKGYYADKLTSKYISDVEMSAPLHDVGKINISDTILNAPRKLTDEEFEIMKTHTIAGKEIMEKAISTVQGESYLKEARNMAAYHHEKWDGSGYPEGLRGEVIPLSARVMAVADVFDALVSRRVYKPAMPFDKAVSIIQKDSGKHFDPKCVEAFMDSLDEVKRVMRKYDSY